MQVNPQKPIMRNPLKRPSPRSKYVSDIGLFIIASITLVVLLFPIAWMVSTAFKTPDQVFKIPPAWIPETPSLMGVKAAQKDVPRLFFNSVVVATGAVLLSTIAGGLTAYGISRLRFRGGDMVMLFFLSSMAFPIPLLMMTIYLLFFKLGMLDTYAALILSHSIITLPVAVWLLKGFIDTIPIEVEEAATIDGAGPLYIVFRIVFPMARPGMTAAGIFVFVTSWNEFVFGLTFSSSLAHRPLPAGISMLFLEEFQYEWPQLMAVAMLVTVPIVIIFLIFQRQFIAGVTGGAVKG